MITMQLLACRLPDCQPNSDWFPELIKPKNVRRSNLVFPLVNDVATLKMLHEGKNHIPIHNAIRFLRVLRVCGFLPR